MPSTATAAAAASRNRRLTTAATIAEELPVGIGRVLSQLGLEHDVAATALVRHPDGTTETVPLANEGESQRATWAAPRPGLYAIDLAVRGRGPDGAPVERVAFLAVEAQPPGRSLLPLYLAAAEAVVGGP